MDIPPFDDLFKQIKTNIWFTGIRYHERLDYKFYVPFFSLVQVVVEEFSFFVVKMSSVPFLELTALVPCFGIAVLSVAKILCIALERRKIFDLTESLKLLYQNILADPRKKELVASQIIFIRLLTKYFFILNAILVSLYNFSVLVFIPYDYYVKGKLIFSVPYAVVLPFEYDTWPKWLVVYLHSSVMGFFCVLYFATVDALYYNLSSHVCNSFVVLGDEIQRLNINNIGEIRELIKKHQYILKLSNDLEEIFTAPNLFNVLIGSILICALGFNIMMGDWARMPMLVLFLLSEFLQILLMSMFGENLMRESRKICDAVYMCGWCKMDKKSKELILILMIRSNKPQLLTAYKFSTICYQSFSKIISTSWSYFTILRTVYKTSDEVPTE